MCVNLHFWKKETPIYCVALISHENQFYIKLRLNTISRLYFSLADVQFLHSIVNRFTFRFRKLCNMQNAIKCQPKSAISFSIKPAVFDRVREKSGALNFYCVYIYELLIVDPAWKKKSYNNNKPLMSFYGNWKAKAIQFLASWTTCWVLKL